MCESQEELGDQHLASARRLVAMAQQAAATGDHLLAAALRNVAFLRDHRAAMYYERAGRPARQLEALALAAELALHTGRVDQVTQMHQAGLELRMYEIGGQWADRLDTAYHKLCEFQDELVRLTVASNQPIAESSPSYGSRVRRARDRRRA